MLYLVSTRMIVRMMITRDMNADDYRSGVLRKKKGTQQFSVATYSTSVG